MEHRHQLELQQKGFENRLGSDMMNALVSEVMKYLMQEDGYHRERVISENIN